MMWDRNELVDVSCDLCRAMTLAPVILRPDGLQVVECADCGLCFINPRPKNELVARLYDDAYYTKRIHSDEVTRLGYLQYEESSVVEQHVVWAKEKVRIVNSYIELGDKICLEIGCATGEFASVVSGQCREVVAIDLSSHAIATASSRYHDVDFRVCDITQVEKGKVFDVVFAFEVIEHVLSPREFLSEIMSRLSPGGLIFVSTPNYECAKHVGIGNWIGFDTSFEHLYFLSTNSIKRYGQELGFDLVDVYTGAGDGRKRKPVSWIKGVTKGALANIGLLSLIRKLRTRKIRHVVRPLGYKRDGSEHNVFWVLRRK